MFRRLLSALGVVLMLVLAVGPGIALAHQTIQVGNYDVEYGWTNEPVIVNQPNAIVINVAPHATASAATAKITVAGASDTGNPVATGGMAGMALGTAPTVTAPQNIDVSGLKIEAVYGGETKTLTLQPLGENTPGQFVAPLLPTRMGQITIRLSGKLGGADIKTVEVQPEEVQGTDAVAFPKVAATPTNTGLDTAGLLGVGGFLFGVIGTLLGAVALMRRK